MDRIEGVSACLSSLFSMVLRHDAGRARRGATVQKFAAGCILHGRGDLFQGQPVFSSRDRTGSTGVMGVPARFARVGEGVVAAQGGSKRYVHNRYIERCIVNCGLAPRHAIIG
eukprot:31454-Eustigmatos_ZCMA.PRE.1